MPLDPTNESGSVVYEDVTLDDSRFDPSKGVTVNGGSNVQVTYSMGAGKYDGVNALPSNFDWSQVKYIMVHADLAAGQSMNVEIPLKIDTSKLNQSLIYGGNGYSYWESRFNVGETMFLINNQYVRKNNLRMRLGAPLYDLNDRNSQYFLLTYRNSNSQYLPLPVDVYKDFDNSADAAAMRIGNNVHVANFHHSNFDNATLYRQAVNSGDHVIWTGAVHFIELPAMQKVLTKYGYSFNLNGTNTAVMPYYAYNDFGGTIHVQGGNSTVSQAKGNGIQITPDLYIEVHQILAGQDVTVQGGKVIKIGDRTTGDGIGEAWNYLDNVAVAKGLNGANEVAVAKSTVSSPDAANVNTAKDGDYTITLQRKLADGETVTTHSVVHVIPLIVKTTESHDVTRTINLHHLDGTVATTVQKVNFTRTKTTTDGNATYGAWTVDGTDSFARFMIPAIAGYHAETRGVTVTSIYPVKKVSVDDANQVFDIFYVANQAPSTTPTTPVNPSTTPTTPVTPSTTPTTPVNPSTTPNKPSDQSGSLNNNNGQSIVNNQNGSTVTVASSNATATVVLPAEQTTASSAHASAQQANSNKQQQLPQTGNDKTAELGLVGLAMAGFAMLLGGKKLQKK